MNDLISTFAKVQREETFPCPRCGRMTMGGHPKVCVNLQCGVE